MINPGRYNITAYQGATYNFEMIWSIDEVPVNLTPYTAAMQVRENANSVEPILSLTSSSGITLGGTAGSIAVNIPASTMGSAVAGNYVYDLELANGSEVVRLIQGSFAIQAEITK